MKSLLLPLHLVGAGLWLGCVLTEVLFERALLGKGRAQELLLAALHRRVDLLVELPAFLVVLLTGATMLASAAPTPVLHAKIAFGLGAIAANAGCVWLVLQRARAASAGDWARFSPLDALQHKVGAVVQAGLLAALGLGLYRHAGT